jgi:hypothetical protein
MVPKLIPQALVYARALLCASPNLKRPKVWFDVQCAWWAGGAWASAEVEGTHMEWREFWGGRLSLCGMMRLAPP